MPLTSSYQPPNSVNIPSPRNPNARKDSFRFSVPEPPAVDYFKSSHLSPKHALVTNAHKFRPQGVDETYGSVVQSKQVSSLPPINNHDHKTSSIIFSFSIFSFFS